MNGRDMIVGGVAALAAAAAVTAVMLTLLELAHDRGPLRLRRWFAGCWLEVAAIPWPRLPTAAAAALAERLGNAARLGFGHADRQFSYSAVFIALMFAVLPALAFLNVAVGGRARLALAFVAVAAGLAIFNFTGECRRLTWLNGTMSIVLALSVMVLVPAYVLRAFTDRLLHDVPGDAVLESVLVAPIAFILARSLLTFWEGLAVGRHAAPIDAPRVPYLEIFLASLPAAFVLIFLVAALDPVDPGPGRGARSWLALLVALGSASTALTATMAAATGARSWRSGRVLAVTVGAAILAAALSLAVAAAAGAFAPDTSIPWLVGLPWLPLLAVIATVAVALLAKAVVAPVEWALGAGTAARWPFAVASIMTAVVAALAGCATYSLGGD